MLRAFSPREELAGGRRFYRTELRMRGLHLIPSPSPGPDQMADRATEAPRTA